MTASDDYVAATTGAALFGISGAGLIEATGPEAPEFLHNLATNDVKGLAVGAGCEAFFCNVRARALFHTDIYHVLRDGEHALWIGVTPGYHTALFQHLDKHLIAEKAELRDRSAEFALLHLTGPQSASVLGTALGLPLTPLGQHEHMERMLGSLWCHITRRDWLGQPGFDVRVKLPEVEDATSVLVAAGATLARAETREVLRIEAGTPIYGQDIDENRFVCEVGRLDAISYNKGCYLGQEPIVMARDRAGHLNRYFRGLRFDAPVSAGATLVTTIDAGIVTSSTISPRFGPIGLGYVRRGNETAGTVLRAGADGPTATVESLPFSPSGGS